MSRFVIISTTMYCVQMQNVLIIRPNGRTYLPCLWIWIASVCEAKRPVLALFGDRYREFTIWRHEMHMYVFTNTFRGWICNENLKVYWSVMLCKSNLTMLGLINVNVSVKPWLHSPHFRLALLFWIISESTGFNTKPAGRVIENSLLSHRTEHERETRALSTPLDM